MINLIINIEKHKTILAVALCLFLIKGTVVTAQQIKINTVEKMPNIPSTYFMRDWKKVAAGYDSLVFNSNLSGQYLPLIFDINTPVNYPAQKSFGLHSYVGTDRTEDGEAINILPALVGASLVGIDKSNQNGRNYVLESREYFNKRPEENIYLNRPVTSSGDDWWYETMPNVFFYQLYSLYPSTPEFESQFVSVADRWLRVVYAMGGKTTPWQIIPSMNYRAWSFSTMTPNAQGVPEPEAAGAIAWILYSAYTVTGLQKYRVGAELAMEYLNSLTSNPAYEIQLPYGVYLAARMNAELGTSYNLEKMVNWCFDFSHLRSWGAITGKFGMWDADGLIGELEPRNYAFAMNTFEQIGALVPMVRYDSRFARAIGKWVLNAANSARLFYPNFLAKTDQDGWAWANQYDPNSVIAYEALLKTTNGWIKGTGDAVSGGWSATNLGLYGSSHVGILGAIIDTTNVSLILKLDLLKTDYFRKSAYPSFLMFNPYGTEKSVSIDVGSESKDIYDAVSHSIIARNVQGNTGISIPADDAVIAVLIPAGSSLTYDHDKTLVNNIIIDYMNGMAVQNYLPRIKDLSSVKDTVMQNDSTNVYCTAVDKDNQQLSYVWKSSGGTTNGSGYSVKWISPNATGKYIISVYAVDPSGAKDSSAIEITVTQFINSAPTINKLKAVPRKINLGSTNQISCDATDANGDSLSYSWSAQYGYISGNGKNISWTAPNIEGNYFVKCSVADTHGASVTDSIDLEVRDFSKQQTGNLIAFYPFNGNANDQTGAHNGSVNGAMLTKDRFGNANQAYSFNGTDDYIRVPNSSSLNFGKSITVSLWFKIGTLFNREAFLISHGSWQNRWKLSITNQKLRWTVKTNSGVKDLDSETKLAANKLYLATAVFSGSDMELWLNGELDSFGTWSGDMLTTSNDLTIAQMLTNDNNYNFSGIIDDVRLYDYALPVDEIKNLYDIQVEVRDVKKIPVEFELFQNYPNPFNPTTSIEYSVPSNEKVVLDVYDILGKKIVTLVNEVQQAGYYRSTFSILHSTLGSGVYFYRLTAGNYSETRKMLLLK